MKRSEKYNVAMNLVQAVQSALANSGDDRTITSGHVGKTYYSLNLDKEGGIDESSAESIKFSTKADYVHGTPAGRIEIGKKT